MGPGTTPALLAAISSAFILVLGIWEIDTCASQTFMKEGMNE